MNTNSQRMDFLPPQVPRHFRGRERERALLLQYVEERRWCGLFGVSGSGKSTLAANVGWTAQESKLADVVWIKVGSHGNVDLVLESLARAMGETLVAVPTSEQIPAFLRGRTSRRGLFVIFDDVNDDETLERLLESVGPGNAVLVTGLNQSLTAVVKYNLATPNLSPLSPEEATSALLQIAQVERSSLQGNIEEWTQLAASVAGSPKALELIGGELRCQSIVAPHLYLPQNSSLEVGPRVVSILREVSSRTLSSLSQEHLRVFYHLGVFLGRGVDAASVAAVSQLPISQVEEALGMLYRRMIIARSEKGSASEHRGFSLHDEMRFLARDRLKSLLSEAEFESARERYVVHYHQLLEKFGGYEWNLKNFPRLIPHEDEIFHAIDTCLAQSEAGDPEAMRKSLQMAIGASWYMHWRGYDNSRLALCQRVVQRYEQLMETRNLNVSRSEKNIIGNLCADQGWVEIRRNRLDEAQKLAKKAEEYLRGGRDSIFAVELSGQIALESGQIDTAEKTFRWLCRSVQVKSRSWFVFSFRLADALYAAHRQAEYDELIERLLRFIKTVRLGGGDIIEDVHARILFRWAVRGPGRCNDVEAVAKLQEAAQLFEKAGNVSEERVYGLHEVSRRLPKSARSYDLLKLALKQAKVLGMTSRIIMIEQEMMDRYPATTSAERTEKTLVSGMMVLESDRPLNVPATTEIYKPPEHTMSIEFPELLKKAKRERKLALFVGAGLSLGRDVKGNFPNWTELPTRFLDACKRYDRLNEQELQAKRDLFAKPLPVRLMLAELGSLRVALADDYQNVLTEIFRPRDAAPGEAHKALLRVGASVILTTNYDLLIERTPVEEHLTKYTWKNAGNALNDVKYGHKVLFKIHGTAEHHDTVVMSEKEYDMAHSDESYQAVISYLLVDRTFLFVGYGMNDPLDLDLVLKGVGTKFKEARNRHYALMREPEADPQGFFRREVERLDSEYNVKVIKYKEHAELPKILNDLALIM